MKNYLFTLRCKGEDPELVRIPVRAESENGAYEALGVFFLAMAQVEEATEFNEEEEKLLVFSEDRKSFRVPFPDGQKEILIERVKEFSFLK